MPARFPKRDYRPRAERRPPAAPAPAPAPVPAAATAWEQQAGWYAGRHGAEGDDFHRTLILPAVVRHLAAKPGERVLDVGSGPGLLGRALSAARVGCTGVDASPALVEAARARAGKLERYIVGDARALGGVLGDERFSAAAAVLSLQDLDPIEPVLAGVAAALRPGGKLVIVLTHPCFRIPRRTSWGWDEQARIQYRRIDGYMSSSAVPIRTHPGRPADQSATTSFHRPLSRWIGALGQSGFGVVGAEELCSNRRGTRGARFAAEDFAAREIPVFLVLVARTFPAG